MRERLAVGEAFGQLEIMEQRHLVQSVVSYSVVTSSYVNGLQWKYAWPFEEILEQRFVWPWMK